MLQQTTVAVVTPYFSRFLERWPDLPSLARANLDDVLCVWAGLGYYKRARLLYECAQQLVREHAGHFPQTEAALALLPGIGPYTAAALTAIAFEKKANVVDGNVERVMARLYAVRTPLPKAKPLLKSLADTLVPEARWGAYAQALMDLGALVCTPRAPSCSVCPWQGACRAFLHGAAADFPKRTPKKRKPLLRCVAFVLTDENDRILLRRRPERGLLASMMGVPTSAFAPKNGPFFEQAPTAAAWCLLEGEVTHVFTHFSLRARIAVARIGASGNIEGAWTPIDALAQEALPSLMRKILLHAGLGQ